MSGRAATVKVAGHCESSGGMGGSSECVVQPDRRTAGRFVVTGDLYGRRSPRARPHCLFAGKRLTTGSKPVAPPVFAPKGRENLAQVEALGLIANTRPGWSPVRAAVSFALTGLHEEGVGRATQGFALG